MNEARHLSEHGAVNIGRGLELARTKHVVVVSDCDLRVVVLAREWEEPPNVGLEEEAPDRAARDQNGR